MTRHESRELAFILLFEHGFTGETIADILENDKEAREMAEDRFAVDLAQGVIDHLEEIDRQIADASHNWNVGRLSRVALAVMRLSVYEMLWREDIPVSVSINEAVELAKQYGSDTDSSFINGVLGGIARKTATHE